MTRSSDRATTAAVAAPTPVPGAPRGSTVRRRLRRVWRWLPLLVVWLLSATYVGSRLDRGWIPFDEGTIAHPAERVLQGELPHRDFDDVYTGGLARFDAVVFRVLGTRLIALRIAMFAVFLLWIPAVYYIATRFAGPVTAAAVTLLCVVWSIPTYPAAMPSWYNLFLADLRHRGAHSVHRNAKEAVVSCGRRGRRVVGRGEDRGSLLHRGRSALFCL